MRTVYRICSVLLAAVILLGGLCSCDLIPALNNTNDVTDNRVTPSGVEELDRVSSKTAGAPVIPEYSGKNTLTVALDSELGRVSPFFAETDAEIAAARLVFTRLVGMDRGGAPVLQGISGQTAVYKDEEYTYYGIADTTVTKNSDGTADYSFTLREDAFFSDGTNITADDVIFSMYVLLDPSYRGSAELGDLPIVGLDDYLRGMSSLADFIYYSDSDEIASVASSDIRRFREKLEIAQQTYVEGILGYVREHYSVDSLRKHAGKWTDKAADESYLGAIAMVALGYAEWQKDEEGDYTGALVTDDGAEFGCIEIFPSYADFFSAVTHSVDSLLDVDGKCREGDLESALRETFGSEYDDFFEVKRAFGKSAGTISGITKTGMYSLTVHLDRYHAADIYGFTFFIAPLHAYGSREEYKYTEGRFGFDKGDVGELRDVVTRVSSGAYYYRSVSDGTYRLERNTLYYLGCPYVRYVDLIPVTDGEDVAASIAEGKYDIAMCDLDEQIAGRLDSVNRDGDKVISVAYSNGEYGYIGLSCLDSHDGALGQEQTALRRAFCVLISLYSDIAADTYLPRGYTHAASLAIDGTYTLPSATENYSCGVDGESIYTENMSAAQRRAAAVKAALTFFSKAGYTLNEAESYVIAAPEGGTLEFEFLMLRGEAHSVYLTEVIKNTSEALDRIGITLRIAYADGVSELESAITGGEAQIWAYSRTLSTEPQLYSYYHSESAAERSENLTRVAYRDLDALLSDAVSTTERENRAALYADVMRMVYGYGVEIPLYHTSSVLLMSDPVYSESTPIREVTDFYSWCEAVNTLKLP